MENVTSATNVQIFSYLFILDLGVTIGVSPQEIIEIACLKLSTQSKQVEDTFRQYVRPKLRPILRNVTTAFTQVTQAMVNSAPHFNVAWDKFMKWYKAGKGDKKAAFVTIDNWDIKESLRAQSLLSKVNIAKDFRQWINLKRVYYKAYNFFPRTVEFMMQELKLPFQGHIDNAYDDATNAALVAQRMLRENIVFRFNNDEEVNLGPWPSERPDRKPYVPPKESPWENDDDEHGDGDYEKF